MKTKTGSLKNRLMLSYLGVTFVVLVMMGAIFYGFIQRYARDQENEAIEMSGQQVANEMLQYMESQPSVMELEHYFQSIEIIQDVSIDFITDQGDSIFSLYEDDQYLEISRPIRILQNMMQNFKLIEPLGQGQGQLSPMRNAVGNDLAAPATPGQMNPNNRASQWMKKNSETGAYNQRFEVPDSLISIDGMSIEGYLTIDFTSEVRTKVLQPAMVAYGIASGLALLLAALIGWWMGRKLSRPITELSSAVQGMGEGNLGLRINGLAAEQKNEIGLLSNQFNSMADELETAFTKLKAERDTLKNFLSDASHELRTPLTALIAYIELLEAENDADKHPQGPDMGKTAAYLEKGLLQADRMKSIIEDLLALSRLESSAQKSSLNGTVAFSYNRIGDIIDEVLDNVQAHDSEVMLSAENDLLDNELFCNRELMLSILQNVIQNSVKFSRLLYEDGGIQSVKVDFTVKKVRDNLVCIVSDNGPGIREEELDRIFDRFYRSSAQSIDGNGLGLAIVKSAVLAHGGTITMQNRNDDIHGTHGAVCTITIPLS